MARMRTKAAAKREAFRLIASETLDLKADRSRRFRNAILSLVLSDPRWMMWVERTLPPHIEEIDEDIDIWLILVEAAARWRVLAAYGFFYNRTVCHLIFRHDWAFTDRGTLSPG
jgi:hypothetical protein